jgi:pyrimidine operon attenuation protein/uracil phosphoribosyltransferase
MKITLLNKQQIEKKLNRIAFQIVEQHIDTKAIALVGIAEAGLVIANKLAEVLKTITTIEVQVIALRMDKKQPLNKEIELSATIQNQPIILVDDVCNSGKTLAYALIPLLKAAPSSIKIAVLVERKHTAFPIAPDFVGLSVATTLQDHIIVETTNNELIQAYLQ